MSEHINNREYRQQKLKELIKRLHDGASVEEVQEEFHQLTSGITATEITEMEQALVDEGMPVADIQRLCDVHASVFKGSIEDIHKDSADIMADYDEWHPVSTFKMENRAIEALLDNEILKYLSSYIKEKSNADKELLKEAVDKLTTIDKHYSRKENLLFPYMEKYNITAPPQVMWGVDDEIRDKIKSVQAIIKNEIADYAQFNDDTREMVTQVHEMIFKEEKIMFPMVAEIFTQDEWVEIEKSSAEIGFTLLDSIKRWMPAVSAAQDIKDSEKVLDSNIDIVQKDSQTEIVFDAGSLTSVEINSILNTLPLDMTFVGADNRVKYFTQGSERIFDRPITIIGREIKHCHPPKSIEIVEQIVDDLRTGKKDNEDFWIKMGDMFVYIRYFAVRNKQGEFLGTLEVTQDIKAITDLEGEKRLRS